MKKLILPTLLILLCANITINSMEYSQNPQNQSKMLNKILRMHDQRKNQNRQQNPQKQSNPQKQNSSPRQNQGSRLTLKYQNDGFANFLRNLPRKPMSARVKLYNGQDAGMERYKYCVVNMPLLGSTEQCADVCMHLRAEYFFRRGEYNKIHFNDVNGKNHPYKGGASRKEFNKYLLQVFAYSNTYSMYHEMHTVPLHDIRPGDVFIYPATNGKLGHVMMVFDVATDSRGNIYYQMAQGYTPACELHIIRNNNEPNISPWRRLDVNAQVIDIFGFRYIRNQLKRW